MVAFHKPVHGGYLRSSRQGIPMEESELCQDNGYYLYIP